MTTYEQRYALAIDPVVQARVQLAIVEAAVAISAEAQAGDAELHEARQALAGKVLKAPSVWASLMVYGVVSNPNAGTGSSDPMLEDGVLAFVVSSIWNAYAEA